MLSMPIALLAYLPKDPAITMLGTARYVHSQALLYIQCLIICETPIAWP
jgi:hypothetical protein